MALIEPRTLKGFRDYLPETMMPRERLMETARGVYRSYGFAPIDTPALEYEEILTGKGGRAVEPRWIDYSHRRTPLPRLGRSEDVANAALFLASDESTFITGENLMVDGGWMAN